ncbi:TPA: hypothetical protein ACH3X3_009719 [Trebouxia sp. C0006]
MARQQAAKVQLLSHNLPVNLFHQHTLLRMALCCYSRDYRAGPFASMKQLLAQLHSMQKAFKSAQG